MAPTPPFRLMVSFTSRQWRAFTVVVVGRIRVGRKGGKRLPARGAKGKPVASAGGGATEGTKRGAAAAAQGAARLVALAG
eukprot:4648935-Prymnesium_polylepis.1